MKRRVIALVLAVFLLCGLTVPASAALEADVRNSVVVVSTCMDTPIGEYHFGFGTGFFINDQYLITNHHVVDQFFEWGAGELYDVVLNSTPVTGRAKIRAYIDSDEYEEAYIVGYDEIRDIAILRLDEPTTERTPLKLKTPTQDMVTADIYAVGYPGLADNVYSDATDTWGKNDATITSGTISRLFTQSGTGRQTVQIDCSINGGNSGGPVVTSEGYVVGIATETVRDMNTQSGDFSDKVNYAVNISEVILLLNQYGVAYTLADSTPQATVSENVAPTESQVDAPVISTEPAATAAPTEPAVTAAPTEPAATVAPAAPVTPDVPVAPAKETNNLVIILISVIAVLIIAALVVVIILMMKKNKTAQPVGPVMPVAQPIVRSYSKTNYGTSVSVSAQPVLIGRGGNCGLRFPEGTPGVSGSHCSVQYDATTKDFIVTDMNSTYGTYLMSGQKMRPNEPYRMRSGDKFYLAEQGNTIGLSLE